MGMANGRVRSLWILCVAFGAGVIAFVVWFGGVIPTQTCDGAQPPGGALMAYQLSRTPAEIEAVFGREGDPCRPGMIAAMDRANRVDLIGFIATYNAFLAFFFLALLRAGAGNIARAGLVAVLATALFDGLETATQLYITGSLPGSGMALMLLTIGSRGKFLGLAFVSLCAGAAMIGRGRSLGRVVGAVTILGAVLVVVGLASPAARPALSAGSAIAWTLLLLYAIAAALREKA
jgi:hypothetical protein